eukprot:12010297-Ditylum_brightwellii.AAC.1
MLWWTIVIFSFVCHFNEWQDHLLPIVRYQRVVIKDATDKALFKQHVKHFSQASGTPPTVAPITSFGNYAEQPMGVAFREGTLDLDQLNVNHYTEFLQELQCQPTDLTGINTDISPSDVKRNYQIWGEAKSKSPSEPQLGLYKTWVKVPEEQEEEYQGLTSQEFFTVARTMMMIYKHHNRALSKWLITEIVTQTGV